MNQRAQTNRRQFLAMTLMLTGAGALVLTGCGSGGSGGGGGNQTRTRTVQGTLSVPSGFTLDPASLSVETGFGGQPVMSGATFRATVRSDGDVPTMAWARNADAVLLFGFLGGDSSTQTVDAASTALTLLYFGLGGTTLPAENTATLLGLLRNDPAFGPLAETVGRRIAADPLALAHGDTEIGNALKTAVDAIVSERPASSRARSAPSLVNTDSNAPTRSRAASGAVLTLVEPGARQSNVEVLQGDAAQTLIATNHGRRHCKVRLYEIGTVDSVGTRTDYPKARLVNGNSTSLGSTGALGIASTIWNFFSGQTAFVPVSTPPISLAMADNATKTLFEMVVLGSTTLQFEPGFFSEGKYADDVAGWRTDVKNLNLTSWFFDIIFGILLEVWGLHGLTANQTAIDSVLNSLRNLEIANWLAIVTAAENGDISGATTAFLRLFSSDSNFARSLQAILAVISPQIRAIIGQEASAASFQLVTTAVSAAFAAVGSVLGAGDLGAVLYDLANAQRGDRWSVTLFQPTLTLSPTAKTIAPGQRVTFNVTAPAQTGGTISYAWTQTGALAILSSSDGVTGQNITTFSKSVDLVTTPSDQGTITVSVVATVTDSSGAKSEIGRAQAIVTLSAGVTVGTTILSVIKEFGGMNPSIYIFYVVGAPPQNWVKCELHGSYAGGFVYKSGYDLGAPEIDPTRNTDISTFVPYSGSSFAYNLGGGAIGFASRAFFGGNVSAADVDKKLAEFLKILTDEGPVTATFT